MPSAALARLKAQRAKTMERKVVRLQEQHMLAGIPDERTVRRFDQCPAAFGKPALRRVQILSMTPMA